MTCKHYLTLAPISLCSPPKRSYHNTEVSFLTVPHYDMNQSATFCLPQSLPITSFPFVLVYESQFFFFSLSAAFLISPDPSILEIGFIIHNDDNKY